MLPRMAGAATAALLLSVSSPVAAQFGGTVTIATMITFTLPLNLTQLPPDLERVRVVCMIGSDALVMPAILSGTLNPMNEAYPFKADLWVAGGQVVATASVQIPIATEWLKDPIGKTANYRCGLLGYSKSLQRWEPFSETPSAPVFLLKPVPTIEGTFVW